jgi:hypothetical protein
MRKYAKTAALAAATAYVAMVAAAAPAKATGPLVASAPRCDVTNVDRVFLRWADAMSYFLAPNGDFESGAGGWDLDGSTRTVSDNEPWKVSGAGDGSALELPAGSRATSAAVCVGLAEPTLRFFAKRTSGSVVSLLQVDVLFEDASGEVRGLPIGVIVNDGSWRPTPVLPLLVNLLPLLPGDKTPVAFRFTPRGEADWRIDDVHVDPWKMN